MRIQFPKLFIACCLTAAALSIKSYTDDAKKAKYQESVLKSYNLPADEYKSITKRIDKGTVEFTHIADSLSIDKQLKQMFKFGQKSTSNKSITLAKALKMLKK